MNSKIHNLSVQGKTDVILGFTALIFIYFIDNLIVQFTISEGKLSILPISYLEILLVVLSLFFILISYFLIVLINKKRRMKINKYGWDLLAKKIRIIFLIHLLIGGILAYFLMSIGKIKYVIPTTIILYGLACIISNKYTRGNTMYLGLFFLINGIGSIIFTNIQIQFWAISFGIYHIIYGIIYLKKS